MVNSRSLSVAVCVALVVFVSISVAAYTVTDDFEDGDVTIEGDVWDGWMTQETGQDFEAVSDTNVIEGIYSGRIASGITGAGAFAEINTTEVDASDSDPTNISVKVKIPDSSGIGEDERLEIIGKDTNDVTSIFVRFNGQHDITTNGPVGSATKLQDWEDDTVYTVTFYDIDYEEHTFRVSVNGNAYGPFDRSGTIPFQNISRIDLDYPQGAIGGEGIYVDDFSVSGDFSTGTGDLVLDVDAYMEHGAEQDYQVTFVGTDVTDNATVTSGDTDVIFVDNTSNVLRATSDESKNERVTITAEYEGRTTTENVTVANKTLDNIAILPPPTWPSALFGHPGDTTGGTSTWPGAVQLQWIFVCLVVGAVISWRSANPWMGMGAVEGMLLFGWAIDWVSDGLIIASFVFLIYASLSLTDIASGNLGPQTRT